MKRARSSTSNSKLLLRLAVFVVCVVFILQHTGKKYEEATAHNNINAWTLSRYTDFYALPQESLDMAFIGSSHSYCTFDPANFDDALGISSFQLGTPLQHMDTSYFSLRDTLRTQTPSVVVLEVYWDMLDDEFDLKQAATFFEVLGSEELKEDYIDEVFPMNEKVKYSLLPIRYQQDYFNWQASLMQEELEETHGLTRPYTGGETNGVEYYLAKGYTYCDQVLPQAEYDETNQFKGLDGSKYVPNDTKMAYLQAFADLCKEKGITLILVTAPIAKVSMDYIANYDQIHSVFQAFADENGLDYLDYNLIDLGLENKNFRDDAHLNDSGVKIVNAHFCEFLQEKNIFASN